MPGSSDSGLIGPLLKMRTAEKSGMWKPYKRNVEGLQSVTAGRPFFTPNPIALEVSNG